MRDFPFFHTENGVASLILKEIPYRATAYIRLQDASDPDALLKECVEFCRAVGAERIFGTGHEILMSFPLYTQILEMRCPLELIPDTDASLFPVTEITLERWREIYNKSMASVPNASYMSSADGKAMLKSTGAYFIHRVGTLIGIGIASGEKIDAVAACVPGAGETVVSALCHALSGDVVQLEVASTNERAIKLYNRMGFITTRVVSSWYQVL